MARVGIGVEVEGVHAVAAALRSGRVRELLVERRSRDAVAALVDHARSSGVPVEMVDDLTGIATTTAPQGVVARCHPIAAQSLDVVIASSDPAALLVLDHIVDPRNVGAIARSAVAAGVLGLVVAGRRSAPLGATAFKAAAGAFEHLAIAQVSSVASAVSDLKRRGVWVVGLDAGAETTLFGLDLLTEPVAIVLGAEGSGLGRLVSERVDVVASIPMTGPMESLNVSVTAALAAYEIARTRST